MKETDYVIVGLGNPGDEYSGTRHNAGADVVASFHRQHDFPPWNRAARGRALSSRGAIGGTFVTLLLPQTLMNASGPVIPPFVAGKEGIKRLIIVHDDIDMPLGALKISFGRHSGGHKGVESVIKSAGTRDFIRLRVGIMPFAWFRKLKKSREKKEVRDFVLGEFTVREKTLFTKVVGRAENALEAIIREGYERAMNRYNVRGA